MVKQILRVENVATTPVATEPNNEVLLQRMEQLENELKL